jgi:two-component system, NtrC family, nitrogen regulation response regulator NtrX
VRVISATNRDLSTLVGQKKFREDLYYRLSVVPIRVPPLRERTGDIRPLAEYFLEDFCRRNNFKPKQIEAEVWDVLRAHRWPGNVRELRNIIERMAILTFTESITVESLPLEIRISPGDTSNSGLDAVRTHAERNRIQQSLEQNNWNVSAAARSLGIGRTRLHKRIRALGIICSH